jgi:hypothetical protein
MRLEKDFEIIFNMKAKQDFAESKMERAVSAEGIAAAGLLGLGISMVINSFFVKIKSVNYFIFNYYIFIVR